MTLPRERTTTIIKVPLQNSPDLQATNVYVVGDGEERVLVDSGWPSEENYSILKRELAERNVDPSKISCVILTHQHIDHSGIARYLADEFGTPMLLHEDDIEPMLMPEAFMMEARDLLRRGGMPESTEGGRRTTTTARRSPPKAPPVERSKVRPIRGGEEIRAGSFKLKLIHVPGHTLGHIAVHFPDDRSLMTGDFILPKVSSNVSLTRAGTDPMGSYLRALAGTARLEVDRVLPGHLSPFTDLRGRANELIAHHRDRGNSILALVRKGATIPFEMGKNLTWSVGSWESMRPIDKQLALGTILAHLRHLEVEGLVVAAAEERDGALRYRPAA